MPSRLAVSLGSLLLFLLAGCGTTTLKDEIVQSPPSFASAPADSGLLAEMAGQIKQTHGNEQSGFRVLDSGRDGLYYRLSLIDSAVSSIDIQTYLWYPDASGQLILERAILAAQRGVRVRLLVDDLILHGHDALIANLHAQPNIEFRLFNPWKERSSLFGRLGEMIVELERLNSRMHDKLLIADGHAAIIGGRNIGDHYFGLHSKYNFHDTDLFTVGPITQKANHVFDSFWNGPWVVSADNLSTEADAELAREQWERIQANTAAAPELEPFPRKPKDWRQELEDYGSELHIGRSKLVFDEAQEEQIDQRVLASMFNFFSMAEKELLIMNAYIIPGEKSIQALQKLSERGVKISILTNSLSSHDVPAVNSHYEPWRDDFLNAGVELYEMRADPAIQKDIVDTPPIVSEFSGLHSKCAVVDGRYVFIGSMNLDPRSADINTEMGAFVDSPELAAEMSAIIKRNMSGANAWKVTFDKDGDLIWVNDTETLTSQPARSFSQRVMNVLMKLGPRDQY